MTLFRLAVRSHRNGLLATTILGVVLAIANAVAYIQLAGTDPASRAVFAREMELVGRQLTYLLPVPLQLDTMMGYIHWRVFGAVPLVMGFWAIVAGASVAGAGLCGTKTWVNVGGKSQTVLVLFSLEDGALRAVVEATDFLATVQVRASSTGQPITDFTKTDFLEALEQAAQDQEQRFLVFLDEFNRCQESARNALMPALDSTRNLLEQFSGLQVQLTLEGSAFPHDVDATVIAADEGRFIQPNDGVLSVRLRGRVEGGPAAVGVHTETGHLEADCEPGRPSICLPLVGTGIGRMLHVAVRAR